MNSKKTSLTLGMVAALTLGIAIIFASPLSATMNMGGGRILAVDDKPDKSTIFKIILGDSGFAADAFNSSTEALGGFRSKYYDVLILDIKMPIMNGYELYEKVQKMDDKVKVCFLTAYGEDYTEEFKARFNLSSSIADSNISFIRNLAPARPSEKAKCNHYTCRQRINTHN